MREGHANISDTLIAVTHLVDIYNDHNDELGENGSYAMLDTIAHGVSSLQELNPIYFTVEEINWVNELTTQLNAIDANQEGDSDES